MPLRPTFRRRRLSRFRRRFTGRSMMRVRRAGVRGRRIVRRRRNRGILRRQAFPWSINNQSAFVKLTYTTDLSLAFVAQAASEHAFRVNSIYDPDYTGTGHQPYLHDQLSALWNTYYVHGAKMNVVFWPSGTSATSQKLCYIRGGDEAAVDTTLTASYLYESKNAYKRKWTRALYTDAGSVPNYRLRHYINLRKFMWAKDWNNYGATFGSNPSDPIYMIVGIAGEGNTTCQWYCHVTITFYVEVRGRKVVAAS